jgi:hypothetical protein
MTLANQNFVSLFTQYIKNVKNGIKNDTMLLLLDQSETKTYLFSQSLRETFDFDKPLIQDIYHYLGPNKFIEFDFTDQIISDDSPDHYYRGSNKLIYVTNFVHVNGKIISLILRGYSVIAHTSENMLRDDEKKFVTIVEI